MFLQIPIPRLASFKLNSSSMPDARKSKPSSPMPHSSARISPYPYPEPSPLAATLSTELPIHLTNRTFKTLHTLVLHIPITLQTILNLLDGFTRDDAIAALTHFEVHIDFQLESIKAQIDSSEPIALLSRLFDLMDGPFSNLETFILIVLLSSRIKGPKHGQRIEQAKDIIRRALYNSLPVRYHFSTIFPLQKFLTLYLSRRTKAHHFYTLVSSSQPPAIDTSLFSLMNSVSTTSLLSFRFFLHRPTIL